MRRSFFIGVFVCICFLKSSAQSKYNLFKYDSLTNSLFGKKYVPFTIETLDGKVITNQDLLGKVTLLKFWFIHCAPCRLELPILDKWLEDSIKHKSFQIFAITFDSKQDSERYIKENGLKFPIAITTKEDASRLNYHNGYPTTILINKKGEIVLITGKISDNHTNGSITYEKLQNEINKLL